MKSLGKSIIGFVTGVMVVFISLKVGVFNFQQCGYDVLTIVFVFAGNIGAIVARSLF